MSRIIRKLGVLALLASALTPSLAGAADEVNVSIGATAAGPGLAVHGYDVVAYFTKRAPTRGSAQYAAIHQGATYHFASKANRDTFQANPAKYAPAFGGFCAYGVAVAKKFDGDPYFWRIHQGRLYLNLNAEIQKAFNKDVAGSVARAEKNWREIAHVPVADL